MAWRRSIVAAITIGLLISASDARGRTKSEATNSRPNVEVYNGYLIVVEGSVGGIHGLRFLLDTGTTITVVDRRVAKRLGVVGQKAKVINFDKTVSVESGVVPEITFGPEQASNVPVLIEDLRYLRPGTTPVDGIIGLDLLRRKNFLVDYAKKRVVFGATASDEMQAAPMRAKGATLCVEAELEGRLVWLVADTGMFGTVLYQRGLEATPHNTQIGEQFMSRTLGGAVESQQAIVSQFRLGGQSLERQVLVVREPGAMRLTDVAGYLGPASLNAKQIVFDFESNQLRWKK